MFRSCKLTMMALAAALLVAAVLLGQGSAGEKKESQKPPATVEALTAELERLRAEIAVLKAQLKVREEMILKQVKEIIELRDRAAAAEVTGRTAVERAANLLQQLREKERQVVGMKQGQKAAGGFANPPMKFVKGKVLKINEEDPGLIQVSLGTDAGVQENHTLEVYRLKNEPAYLGQIRIVDVHKDAAIGRLLRLPGAATGKIEVGDEVASTLR